MIVERPNAIVEAILTEEFEAAPAHARLVATRLAAAFALGIGGHRCGACGQAVPEFGGIAFDDDRNEIRYGGKRVGNLTGQEGVMFRAFLLANGNVRTKEALLNELYARKFYAEGEMPEIKIIDVFVCKLRKKLEPLGLYIGTIWGRGYYLHDPKGRPAP